MSSKSGKTAPRLLQDLLTYDPRHEERVGRNLLTTSPPHYNPDIPPGFAVPARNCRHIFLTKTEQSQLPTAGEDPTHETTYKVASFCKKCRWHLDLIVDFRDNGDKNEPCRPFTGFPIHHFLYQDEAAGQDPYGNPNAPRSYRFCCSAPDCPVELRIGLLPPRFSDHDITLLTNQAHLRKRLETAKEIAGDRADGNMARPVDAPDFLSTYLQDSLNPQKGKARIPLLNRKFLKTFGKDCDHILKRLGFTHAVELEDDESTADVWYLPKPSKACHPLEQDPDRTVVEDARHELNVIILSFPEHERTGVRHPMIQAQPSLIDIERALGCLDYQKRPGRETRSTNHEEDHPYFAGLGAVGDFSDALLLFAFTRQVAVDTLNAPYYFECLQDIAIGRNSEQLGTAVMVLASEGATNRREVEFAYRYFGMDPKHSNVLKDDHIIGLFKSRLQDISPAAVDDARKQLRIIGDARGSEAIKQQSSDAIETYSQAMAWLDLDENQPDDFIMTMYSIKVNENATNKDTATKAVQKIAEHRNSQRLRDFLTKGFTQGNTSMDVSEAYAVLSITNRSEALQLDVLHTQVASLTADNPDNSERYEQAYELVCKDQIANYNNSQINGPARPKKTYDMKTWPVGCENIGNTCYLNSVLQFLFTIKPLRDKVLNCDQFMQELTPEALATKRVGRSAVTAEKVERAQQFVHELRKLFQHMITASAYTVRPETKLAALALSKADVVESKPAESSTIGSGLGKIGGMPIAGPMPPPEAVAEPMPNQATTDLADSVMGDDDAKSDTSSMVAMDLTGPVDDHSSESNKPEPPSRPPPVPPRPHALAQTDTTIKKIESYAEQQDAAEIMNNIFDLLSCALKGEGVLRDGEQQDLIKQLFFSDVTTVRRAEGSTARNSALQDNHLISPGNRDRPLYAALDDEFSLTELEGDPSKEKTAKISKYEYIDLASPIQIINVRRLVFEGGKSKKDESHVGLDKVLYLDRYLNKTKSLSEKQLQELREKHWQLQLRLKALESRKAELRDTEIKMNLPDAVDEAAAFIEDLSKAQEEMLVDVEDDPIPNYSELPNGMRERARDLQKEVESLDQPMKDLDEQINSIFNDCKDHPYRLHAVFMHRGNATGGHYWIYIYDFQENKWRKYNDEDVDEVEEKDIFEQEAKYPATSTGIVFVKEDMVHELTEAVHRELDLPASNEVEMKDADLEYQDVQIIDGVEQDPEGEETYIGSESGNESHSKSASSSNSSASTVEIILEMENESENKYQ